MYVFVVGMPRSGTHLVREILNGSTDVRIGAESRFLGGAKRLGPIGLSLHRSAYGAHEVSTDDGAERVVARIWQAAQQKRRFSHFWRRVSRHVDEQSFLAQLLEVRPRDARHVLELGMLWSGDGRPVCGEKTPHHVFHLDRLLGWYPKARAIHVIRDPRAVYASARARRWTGAGRLGVDPTNPLSDVPDFWFALENALRWRYAMDLDRRFIRSKHPRYLPVRFESLIADPEREVRRLCGFLGLSFEDAMMEPRVGNSSFMKEGTRGFRPEAVDRWRGDLPAKIAALVAVAAGGGLLEHGYRRSGR
jgi:hypothetical protein